jgi:hypothetical protein
MISRSDSPNRMAVDFTPILRSSSRSTIAVLKVSYTVDQIDVGMNSSQAILRVSFAQPGRRRP